MVTRRQQEQQEVEMAIIEHLQERGSGWLTAREIACEIGHPWRKVARAMARIPGVEVGELEWESSKDRIRTCGIYRYWKQAPVTIYPKWLMPTPPLVMTGMGRIVRGYASMADEKTLSESAND